jgi:hypothetical protein
MPQRFLRPGLRNSELWNKVSFPAQSLFVRLLTLVDDYGRYDGRSAVIWAESFAVWNDQNPTDAIDLQQCDKLLQQLAATRLITVYTAESKRVLQINQWQERIRDGVKEKWPKPQQNEVLQQDDKKLQQNSGELLPSSSSSSSAPITIDQSPTPVVRVRKEAQSKLWIPSEEQKVFNRMFRMKDTTPWNEKTIEKYKSLQPIDQDDLRVVEKWMTATIPETSRFRFRRQDLITLLNNWAGEVGKARSWQEAEGSQKHEGGF